MASDGKPKPRKNSLQRRGQPDTSKQELYRKLACASHTGITLFTGAKVTLVFAVAAFFLFLQVAG